MHLPYAVYILFSDKDQQFDIGFTEDLDQRFADHCAGRVPSTASRRPLRLIHIEYYVAKGDALRREQYLKTTKGKRALRLMLQDSLSATSKPSSQPRSNPVGSARHHDLPPWLTPGFGENVTTRATGPF